MASVELKEHSLDVLDRESDDGTKSVSEMKEFARDSEGFEFQPAPLTGDDEEDSCFPEWCDNIPLQPHRVLGSSKVNWLLIFMPFAMISKMADWGDGPTFLLSLLALIPQAQLLGLFTEQVALYTNDAIGGLLNATFGNLTELIISVLALRRGMLRIVQVSLLGSILSNCLLVLGSAFMLGGLRHSTQKFNTQMATTNSGLLMVSTMAMMLPAVLDAGEESVPDGAVLAFSRFTSILLLFIYFLLMVFQIKTHRHLLEEEDGGEEEEQILTFKESIIWLAIDTLLISGFSEVLVGSIEGSAESWKVPKVFIGVIVIPIVGNAAEHASAVLVAMKGKMELALGIAFGSAVQIALFGVPVAVIVAWMMDKPLSLDFHVFESASVLTSVLAVGFLVGDGESNYLKGAMLVVAYIIVAAAFFVHKDKDK
mmetsp:Transcript_26346/g.63519  ORF Transcript_26346/g.63519 Transcript_26346/m.63519 type:complete len:425 (+) Transcript_26346:472-1746(+)|eukprot:CAMPEP_0114512208 /NCGR_PEP_ID=MMETSP0109-20121206/14841_1 /TAXON_ID=29199 /ORGANISM="Chlorarachnion reptans, Strain CCCM449" /LENGTH=424 /DNA_ID=CAMNT_0001691853 /DNA_START=432 /DNA_END=1706 /DNA_ORIENTATION=+